MLAESAIEHEIIVVDSAQKLDATQEVCAENGVICISREGGNLYGDAVKTGIKKASYEYTMTMDADACYAPPYIPVFYERIKRDNADLVIGSRYVKGGTGHTKISLTWMSYLLNVVFRTVLGIKIKDISHDLRLYKSEQLKTLSLKCGDFDIIEEILVKLMIAKKDYKVVEEPVSFVERRFGKSKRRLFKFIISYLKTLFYLKRIQNEAKRAH